MSQVNCWPLWFVLTPSLNSSDVIYWLTVLDRVINIWVDQSLGQRSGAPHIDISMSPGDVTPHIDISMSPSDVTPHIDISMSPGDVTPHIDIYPWWRCSLEPGAQSGAHILPSHHHKHEPGPAGHTDQQRRSEVAGVLDINLVTYQRL